MKLTSPQFNIDTEYYHGTAQLALSSYGAAGGPLALLLLDDDGQPCLKVSANIEGAKLFENEIAVKDYSENRGILEALVSAGYLMTPEGRSCLVSPPTTSAASPWRRW